MDFQLLLTEPSEGVLVFNLSGEVDMGTVAPLREATASAVASGQYSTLVFDLSHLGFMDSTGLHVLTEAHHAMARAGGTTTLVCPAGNLRKIFELTGLNHLFTIVGDREGAFAVAA